MNKNKIRIPHARCLKLEKYKNLYKNITGWPLSSAG
tara:strand:+ start:514 stop:621 length:108 start_codon:yes stop_codon:yes gene_type:complete